MNKKPYYDILLVCGYCHQIKLSNSKYIPNPIIEICKMYSISKKIDDNTSDSSDDSNLILTLGIGNCGINLASMFLGNIIKENKQKLNISNNNKLNDKLCSIAPFRGYPYTQIIKNKLRFCYFSPIDLDPSSLDTLKYFEFWQHIKLDYICFGAEGCNNLWPIGYDTEGAELIDEIEYVIQRNLENVGYFQGYQFIHSIDGGTGGGLTSLIMETIKDPKYIIHNFAVFPSKHTLNTIPVSVYSSVLSISWMNKYSDSIFVIDNNALKSISSNKYDKYDDINIIINKGMNDISTLFRSKYTQNDICGILNPNNNKYTKYYTISTSSDLIDINSNINKLKNGMNISTMIVHRNYNKMNICNNSIPDSINDIVYTLPSINSVDKNIERVTMISNTTKITNVLNTFLKKYDKIFQRQAYLYRFYQEGMEMGDFHDAREDLLNLINEYKTV